MIRIKELLVSKGIHCVTNGGSTSACAGEFNFRRAGVCVLRFIRSCLGMVVY